jgi:hypothetical protein
LVNRNSILFDYDDMSGNVMTCAEVGVGKSVELVDGGSLAFFK